VNPFGYERASDAPGAVALLSRTPNAVFLAGGTNLVDHMKLGLR
jgi:xanthine dehydrogenase YagS FAD-binding subunit